MKYHSDMDFGNRTEISTRILNISNCTREPNFQNNIKNWSGPDPHNLEVYVHLKIGNIIEISFTKQYSPEKLRFFVIFHFSRSSKLCRMGGYLKYGPYIIPPGRNTGNFHESSWDDMRIPVFSYFL